jgi:DNA invertase Pin-like site-specific DNA recombinase
LEPGTEAQNRADRDAKGRLKGGPKLTARRVRHIRRRFALGDSVRTLAKRFGLRFQTVYRAVKGETWSDT